MEVQQSTEEEHMVLNYNRAGAWVTAQITLSAIFYLFDFGTTLATLRTYYYYNRTCSSDFDPATYNIACSNGASFVICLSLLILAHVSNSLIFWITLDPTDHPLRLAYFLPLIHLSRLLKLFWSNLSCNYSPKDLYSSQQEASSLYNVLGASLETVPQLILQFHIAMALGYLYNVIPIPRTLIISLVACVLSGTYNGSTAILSLVPKCTLLGKACIAIIAGAQAIAVMSAKTMMVATLVTAVNGGWYLGPYAFVSLMAPWIFYSVLLRRHNCSLNNKNKWWTLAHSFALAHVSLFIGPMYVIVKYFRKSPYLYSILILGALVQVIVELLGIGEVVICGHLIHPWFLTYNKYLTSHSFFGVLCTSLFLIMLTSVIFCMVDKGGNFPRLNIQG